MGTSSALAAALLLLLQTAVPTADGRIVGAAVIPHGDFAYDPSLVDSKNGSLEIHNAAVALGAVLSDAKPGIIFLATPHGVAAEDNFLVYENSRAEGFAILGADLNDPNSDKLYRVDLGNVSMDANVSAGIVDEAKRRGLNVSGLLSIADDESYPQQLGWGEVIPLSFLNATLNDSRVVIVSAPTRRYDGLIPVPELMSLGKLWYDALEALDESVVWVASVDLAHTHLEDGPYGYSAAAEPFDIASGGWAATLDSDLLLKVATDPPSTRAVHTRRPHPPSTPCRPTLPPIRHPAGCSRAC